MSAFQTPTRGGEPPVDMTEWYLLTPTARYRSTASSTLLGVLGDVSELHRSALDPKLLHRWSSMTIEPIVRLARRRISHHDVKQIPTRRVLSGE